MEKIERWLEAVYGRRVRQEYDAMALVIGGEGNGKSTFMIEATGRWQRILAEHGDMDRSTAGSIEGVLSRLVWERDEFKNALADYPRRSAVPVMDAARVLHKKTTMQPDQVEVEMDLLDSRMKEQLTFYGYQDWSSIPDLLQRRRAHFAFRIPRRGRVEGYSRASLDELYESGDWPEPDLVDSFPNLSGTAIWDEFKRRDREHKEARMRSDEGGDDEADWTVQEALDDVLAGDVGQYVKQNPYNGSINVNKELLQLDYGLSIREAKTVSAGVEREVDLATYVDDTPEEQGTGGEGEAHT